jgi:hypothetical protein
MLVSDLVAWAAAELERDSAFFVDVDESDPRAGMLGDQPPRQTIRGVLGDRQENFIAGVKHAAGPRARHKIDPLGGSAHPRDFIGTPVISRPKSRRVMAAADCN